MNPDQAIQEQKQNAKLIADWLEQPAWQLVRSRLELQAKQCVGDAMKAAKEGDANKAIACLLNADAIEQFIQSLLTDQQIAGK